MFHVFFFIILFKIFNSLDFKLFLGHLQKSSEKYLVSIKQVSLYVIEQIQKCRCSWRDDVDRYRLYYRYKYADIFELPKRAQILF